MQKTEELKNIIGDKTVSFSRYTITDRAIPSLTDGLKIAQRRTIYGMFKDGITHNKYRVKNVKATGSVMAYTPHGNTSIEDVIKRLGNDSVVYKLIDGQGAYGTITSSEDNGGSARYLESRLSEVTTYLTDGLDENAVKFIPTYDEKTLEPLVLPAQFPLILANPQQGIAVGIATTIPSFDMKDIRDNIYAILHNKPTKPMLPTFATKGVVLNDLDVAKQVQETGRGTFRLRATYYIDGDDIHITSIPYNSTIESIISKIISLVNDKDTNSIVYVNDNCGVDGFDITITCKKNVDKESVMKYLFKKTDLESTFSANIYVLDIHNKPKQYGTDDILKEWIKFRAGIIRNVLTYRVENIKRELNLLYALKQLVTNDGELQAVMQMITQNNTNDSKDILMAGYNYNELQAEYILSRTIRQLSRDNIEKTIIKIEELESNQEKYEKILSSKKLIAKEILKSIDTFIENHYIERETQVVDVFEEYVEEKSNIQKQNDYNVRVFVTEENYVKIIPLTSLRSGADIKVKEGDEIITVTETTKSEEILFFTNKQNVYKKRLTELDDCKPSDLGLYANSLIDLEKDEELVSSVPLSGDTKYILIGYKNGKVAKVDVESYRTSTNRKQLKNATAKEEILFARGITDDIDILSISTDDKAVLFNTENVNSKTSKSTQGVTVQKFKNDNSVAKYVFNFEDYPNVEDYRTSSAIQGKRI